MRTFHKVLILALIVFSPLSASTVLTFDDIVVPSQFAVVELPTNYGGISWGAEFGVFSRNQFPYGPRSAPNSVVTDRLPNQGTLPTFRFLSPVVFEGVWVSGSDIVSLILMFEGAPVAYSPSVNTSYPATYLATGYSGLVDSVSIIGTNGGYALDNLTFTSASVPEPSSTMLLSIPILALVLARRFSVSASSTRTI